MLFIVWLLTLLLTVWLLLVYLFPVDAVPGVVAHIAAHSVSVVGVLLPR